MSESVNVEMLMRMLERMPGVAFCSRMDPATGKSQWLYIGKGAAELYDVDDAKLRANPWALEETTHPEDAERSRAIITNSMQTGAPMRYQGRVLRRDGAVTWVETNANIDRDADGTLLWYGMSTDVTESKRLEQSLAASEAERARSEALYKQIIDALPVGVMVMNQQFEFPVFNPAQQRMTGGLVDTSKEVTKDYGVFKADGVTPMPMEEAGATRALRGELLEEEVVIKNPRRDGEVRAHIVWTPLRDEKGAVFASLGAAQDITLQRALESELRTRNEQLAQSEEGKTDLIERLRRAVDELSNPILEVWEGVLAMPIIGVVDSRRTADMVQRLLAEVTRSQASFVIIDLTGVDVVDTKTADHLMRLMKKVEVVGSRCVLTGIRPAVAETLVDIGVDFGRLSTLRNLKHGLREAMRVSRREREGMRDEDLEGEVAEAPGRRSEGASRRASW